jgi:hypothetical protein
MIKFIKFFSRRFFKDNKEIISYNKGISDENKRQRENRAETRRIILEVNFPIGDVFISIGNEWNSLHLVKIIGYNREIPIGRDLLSNKEYVLFSTLIKYSNSMISLLKKLNPYERYSLLNKQNSILDRKDKIEDQDCLFENELSELEFIKLYNKEKCNE